MIGLLIDDVGAMVPVIELLVIVPPNEIGQTSLAPAGSEPVCEQAPVMVAPEMPLRTGRRSAGDPSDYSRGVMRPLGCVGDSKS